MPGPFLLWWGTMMGKNKISLVYNELPLNNN